jgi:hypothetical protein
MRVWYFSEMAYHPAWEEGLKRGSLRVVLSNRLRDCQGHPAPVCLTAASVSRGTAGLQTRRWRKADSNSRSRSE